MSNSKVGTSRRTLLGLGGQAAAAIFANRALAAPPTAADTPPDSLAEKRLRKAYRLRHGGPRFASEALGPPPALSSAQRASEAVEDYWMAIARHQLY